MPRLILPPPPIPQPKLRSNTRSSTTNPSGALSSVPTTGTPSASYPAGSYEFESHVLVVGPEPVIDASFFRNRLAETIFELLGSSASAASIADNNSIVKGAQETTGAMDVLGAAHRWWITIRGNLTAHGAWTTANLNRAIARAFANSVAWRNTSMAQGRPVPPPGDGSMLLAALSQPGACSGASNTRNTFASACTRVGAVRTVASDPVMTPIDAPAASAAYGTPAQRAAAIALNTYVASAPPGAVVDSSGESVYNQTIAQYESTWARVGLGYYDAEVQAQMVKLGVPRSRIAQPRRPASATTSHAQNQAPATSSNVHTTTSSTPRTSSEQPLPAMLPESAIQTRPPVVVTTTPVAQQPPAAQPAAPSRTGTYVAVGLGAAAIGVMWWQRKAIFG